MKEINLNPVEKDIQPADLYALQKNDDLNPVAELIRLHGDLARFVILELSDLMGEGGGRVWIHARTSLERGARIRSMEKLSEK